MDTNNLLNNITFLLTIYALYIGLKNLKENREQSNSQQDLLNYLEKHLSNQDDHLKAQDVLIQNLREEKEEGKSGLIKS